MTNNNIELSIVMPCLNEAETLAICIRKAKAFLHENGVIGEVVIADNGSTDNSQEIAIENGARVVNVTEKGYGNALKGGIRNAFGKFIIMGDSDDSYDFYNLLPFLDKMRAGADLVMGNRFKGGIKKGAMPFLHRYLGNPVLSFIGRLFFNIKVGDFHCGLRGFSKKAFEQMELQTTGMEFASEIVVKASLKDLKITEVPTILSQDGRSHPPHLNTWQDGWRHLRFLLTYSPKWLYFYPGMFLILFGGLISLLLMENPFTLGGINFDVQTLLYGSLSIIVGLQFLAFYVLATVHGEPDRLASKKDNWLKWFNNFNLEKGLITGGALILIGGILFGNALMDWQAVSFGQLNPSEALRLTIPSCTVIVLGLQAILYSFFWHILKLKR